MKDISSRMISYFYNDVKGQHYWGGDLVLPIRGSDTMVRDETNKSGRISDVALLRGDSLYGVILYFMRQNFYIESS